MEKKIKRIETLIKQLEFEKAVSYQVEVDNEDFKNYIKRLNGIIIGLKMSIKILES